MIQDASVSGSGWNSVFQDHLSSQGLGTIGFRLLPGQTAQVLPWKNLNQVKFKFSEHVNVRFDDLRIQGVNSGLAIVPRAEDLHYDGNTFIATWTLPSELGKDKFAIRLSDRITNGIGTSLDGDFLGAYPTGNATPGGDFVYTFDVVPGDGDRNGVTNVIDGIGLRSRLFARPANDNYSAYFDFDGSGQINVLDGLRIRENLFARLPAGSLDLTGPTLHAALLNDTAPGGLTNTDRLTFDATISGTVSDPLGSLSVEAHLDGTTTISVPVNPDGSFSFDPKTIPGFADGGHQVRIVARDGFGNPTSLNLDFILDTLPPAAPALDLSAGSGAVGPRTTNASRVTLVGSTDPNVSVALAPVAATSLSSNTGAVQFASVELQVGSNPFTAIATDAAGNSTVANFNLERVIQTGSQDPVLRWNQVTLDAITFDASSPTYASRAIAIVHAAIYDAVASLEGRPGYYVSLLPPPGASLEAAVSGAAYHVLNDLYPGQQSFLDANLQAALAVVPEGSGKTAGVTFGRSVADAILAMRAGDGWNAFVDYVPGTVPGAWLPTGPTYAQALHPQWANLTPFAMTTADQFLPAGPPDLSSQAWANAYNEVKSLGQLNSPSRTADQTEIARFWADGAGTSTPVGHWNVIAGDAALTAGNSISENARLFAALNLSLGDAAIVAWNAKYRYDFWRPETAIRAGSSDGNAATLADPSWTPLVISPPFPEYVSGHSTYSGAAAAILTATFGPGFSFVATSASLPGVSRAFNNFDEAAEEAGRSRVYGGIHYDFSNRDGLEAGRSLASYVLGTFTTSVDQIAPTVILVSPNTAIATQQNVTVTGRVLDNLSGVATLEAQLDNGAFGPLSFDADGNFSVQTTLPLDGTADGAHALKLRATDYAGNTSGIKQLDFVLDTIAPALTVDLPPAGATLAAGARLTGSVSGTGAALVSLTYNFNGGAARSFLTSKAGGAFNTALDLSTLTAGTHTLNVVARDAAGNVTTVSRSVTLPELIPLTITHVTPAAGSSDVGSTYRPQVFFSRPVNVGSLNATNFYATDTTGTKIPARIVPAADGRFAWLFFNQPLPSASTVTVHVVGDTILAADGGQPLDADGNGTAGGTFSYRFTTVSLVPLAGTSLSGRVYDPGVDLKPMTFDDFRAGPDGALHTADDIFLNPLAGVKVFILGLENQSVTTDAQGYFSFASVPAGNIKLAIDGRTATNAPAGFYFPEMVMDLEILVGQANTVMGTMGTRAQREANLDRLETYLPRIKSSILQSVSDSAATTIGVDAESAPNLTPQQRQYLQLEIQPASLIGPDGQPITGGQVGISAVPPELVRDMLPAGLLQHTFDITIQAPDAAAFATPLQITFPNVFNAAPGTKLNFLSFDHTTGRLVIEGTATVSEDGLSVTSDPGTGITKPGWHGLTPPITQPKKPDDCTPFRGYNAYIVCAKAYFSTFVSNFKNTFNYASSKRAAEAARDACVKVAELCAGGGSSGGTDGNAPPPFELNTESQSNLPISDPLLQLIANMRAIQDSIQTDLDLSQDIANQIEQLIGNAQSEAELTQQQRDQLATLESNLIALFEGQTPAERFAARMAEYEDLLFDADLELQHFVSEKYFYYLENLDNGFVIRGTTERDGSITDIALQPNSHYLLRLVGASSFQVRETIVITASSGESTSICFRPIVVDSSVDSDFDGLTDLVESIIGTNPTNADSDLDGISDRAEIEQGLDPLSGLAFPTGVVASLLIQGEATEIRLVGSVLDTGDQMAYVATGSYGLAIIDVSQLQMPVVVSQLMLNGNALDLDISPSQNLAAVATGIYGIQIVDVAAATSPTLLQSVPLPGGATRVEIYDGLIYAGSPQSDRLHIIDLATGELLESITIGGGIVDLAREGSLLYALTGNQQLRAIDISHFSAVVRGSLTLPQAGRKVFVGNGVAYIGADPGFGQGFMTANVADPDNLILLSDVDANNIAGTAIVANGSGLGISVGDLGFGVDSVLHVVDVSDPTNTSAFVTQYSLPSDPRSVALGAGIAFVANGVNGLQVVNYRSFDNLGQAPVISISSPVQDIDGGAAGIQIVEGTSIPIQVSITDDVQVRNVELLVNGQVVQNDVAFPFDFIAIAPALAGGPSSVSIQVRAIDTGGNTSLSNILSYDLVADSIAPSVVGTTPQSGQKVFFTPSIDVRFDEPLNTALVNAGGVSLIFLGADGVVGGGDDQTVPLRSVESRVLGRRLSIYPANLLDTGNYQVTLDPSIVADRAGNHLAAPFSFEFTIRPASDLKAQSGFPRVGRAPSANAGQEIGFHFPGGVDENLRVTFPTIDVNGNLGSIEVAPSRFDGIVNNAFFVVPMNATTGDINSTAFVDGPLPLQIVPTLNDVRQDSTPYHNGQLVLFGSGFAEGGVTIHFGAQSLIDGSTFSGPDVYYSADFSFENGSIYLTVPTAVPFGPISVSTLGGTSAAFPLTFSGITSTADSGTPADALAASANPGQAITLSGSGFDASSDVVFQVIDINGIVSQQVVRPLAVEPDGSQLTVVVPMNAFTGTVGVVGDQNNTQARLQIVPVLDNVDFTSIAADRSSGQVILSGRGFVEGNNSVYTFGGIQLTDTGVSEGPDVYYSVDFGFHNGTVHLALPTDGNFHGAVTVMTAGGTSAAFAVGYNDLIALAASGTPANAADASANPGQTFTVSGTGLSMTTDLLAQYLDLGGTLQTQLLNPHFVNVAGTEATFLVPKYFNGAFSVHVIGSAAEHLLQIVPIVTGLNVNGNGAVEVLGSGFVEGNNSLYVFGSSQLTDIDVNAGPDVYYSSDFSFQNGRVLLSLPRHGFESFTATTTGGSSVAISTHFLHPAAGILYDVAVDPTNGKVFVVTISQILQIDPANGQTLAAFSLPGGNSGNTGLQVLPTAMTLSGVAIPAGSLLVTNGGASTDKVYAVNPNTGVILATRDLGLNHDPVAGVYHPTSGSLFLLDGSPDQLLQIDPTSGAVLNSFALPIDVNYGGLAIDPVTGNLWIGSSQTTSVSEYTTAGVLVRSVNLSAQGLGNELSGLAFDAAGRLFVSSNNGVVYRLDLAPIAAPAPVLSSISATAKDGNPASGATASANVAQSIELIGTNFTAATRVVFSTRDNHGVVGSVEVLPTAVRGDGTRLEVIVPDLAQTGSVSLLGGSGGVDLHIVPVLSGISGRAGVDAFFSLFGSGFMEGASTVTIGGVTLTDQYTNAVDGDVSGSRNSQFDLLARFAVEGTITVATAGGSFSFVGPVDALPPFVEFGGISANPQSGVAVNASVASANTGQPITLIGRGFTSNTLVQFEAVDASGVAGRLVRSGTINSDGTRLTVTVPALARSGMVKVIGSTAEFPLQIVPTLRSVGGSVTAGNSILLEGTGLVEGGLTVTIDGQVVSGLDVLVISDQGLDQQVVDLTVPAGVSAGVVVVSTAGGSFTLRPAATIVTESDLFLGPDTGDTLATAEVLVDLLINRRLNVHSQSIGDNDFIAQDVDLYRFTANAGDVIGIDVIRQAPFSLVNSYVRLFDATGNELASDVNSGPDGNSRLTDVRLPAAGDYYIGISSWVNNGYDPSVANSGANAFYTGPYQLTVQRVDGGSTSLTGIVAAADSGTAARSGIAAANVGQTITIQGAGLQDGDRVVFTTIDLSGNLTTSVVTPTSVAADGLSLEVQVPFNAASGMVRLERENVGQFLQIVPTLHDVRQDSTLYHNGQLVLFGSGFAEGGVTIHFGAQSLIDGSTSSGPDVYYSADFSFENGSIYLTVPTAVPFGPISVSTLGGTSAAFPLTFSGITSTADSGTPADALAASANPGQAITLSGSGFDASSDVVFQVIDINGIVSQQVVRPLAVEPDGSQLTVVVPMNAFTGTVGVVGDQNNTQARLQIVPVLDNVDFTSIAADRSSGQVILSGRGFVEGNNSVYTFGGIQLTDTGVSEGPDVYYSVDFGFHNGTVHLALPTDGNFHGAVTVMTAGGTSAAFAVGYNDLIALAASGTPANAADASANPGQTFTVSGTGLSMTTDLLAQYRDLGGTLQTQLLNPHFVNVAGTEATFLVPKYFNGAFSVHVIGSAAEHLLQIVPIVTGLNVNGNGAVEVLGSGFVEGNNSLYVFGSSQLTDIDVNAGPDVYYSSDFSFQNGRVLLSLPRHGFESFTATTTGGSSVAISTHFLHPAAGILYDVAVDPTNGKVFVVTISQILQIDPANGQTLAAFSLPGGNSGNTGLQVLPTAMTLSGVAIPAGSLLVTNGGASTDKVYAVNPNTGVILATRDLGLNHDPVAGVYHPTSGSLFLLDGSPDQLLQIDPTSGAVLNSFALPIDVNYGGLAIDPVTGNLWIGSSQTTSVSEYTTAGVLVRSVNLSAQGLGNELSGLAFDAAGRLFVSSNNGVVYRLDLAPIAAPAPVLSSISATAKDGNPASGATASANVAQSIELIGTNFTAATRVVFSTRDNHGVVGSVEVLPTAVRGDGTRLEVIVPDLAQTGSVSLLGGSGGVDLHIVPVLSGISGRAGVDAFFSLFGSGFMEGASTVTIGGVTLTDQYTNAVDGDVSGSRNNQFDLLARFAVEGTITVATAGGSFSFVGPVDALPPFVEFGGISANPQSGVAVNASVASANTGQPITLIGRGFTSNTLVQFEAVDASGVAGRLVRSGTINSDGTRLTVTVPALARSGMVKVIGSTAEFPLQIVPTLRSVGGSVTAGNSILLEGTGLVEGGLTVTIDGQVVSGLDVLVISDQGLDQQVVDLTVPAGVSDGVVVVSTAGGSFTLRPAATIVTESDLFLGPDTGDTLATAEVLVNLLINRRLNVHSQSIGDNDFIAQDVDLYRFTANAGDVIGIDVIRQAPFSLVNSYVRLFDATGNELASDVNSGPDGNSRLTDVRLPAAGDYYIGISSWVNTSYDPSVANSGTSAFYTGPYQLTVQRVDGGSTSLTGIVAAADSGTAARSGIAAANVGQTITIQGAGLQDGDRVVFTTIDLNGNLTTSVVTPASVAADGLSLEVQVPFNAASGMVRLERENVGQFLQIVPTLHDVRQDSTLYHNGQLVLFGSGFAEGGVTIHFGAQPLIDGSTFSGPDVYYSADFSFENGSIYLTVPNGVPFGPISVSTLGGTSAAFPLTFSGITSTADSGTPANALEASANPGQAITLSGSGFDASSDVVFQVIDINGIVSQQVVRPLAVEPDGSQLTVVVPMNAFTGTVGVVGDQNNTQARLQIVPVVTSFDLTGGNGSVTIFGSGLIEGNDSVYTFGTTQLTDSSVSGGPDVYYSADFSFQNGRVFLNLPPHGFGELIVTTAGGSSVPIAMGFAFPAVGTIYDVALDSVSGDLFVATSSQILRVDAVSGQTLAAFNLPGGNSTNTGLQVLPTAMTLGGVGVSAGSLLVTNGSVSFDKLYAVDPTTGVILATLDLGQNIDPVAGVYDPTSGSLFLLDRNANLLWQIDPSTGAVQNSFALAIDVFHGGLALDPVSGNLWIGTSQSTTVSEYTLTGSLVRTVDLAAQGLGNELTGLVFDLAGQLLAASTLGVVYRFDLNV
ncbi:Ig-like domain-containing protein [Stieleria magnilauensis]|uniref:Ig-like domain-containing protein n=1 Tax=Stieleria magnilauensis TaxID=2527963 RepID=UPI003AF5DC4F